MKSSYLNIYSFIWIHWKVNPGKIAFNIKITVPLTIKFIHEIENDRFIKGKENIPQLTRKKVWPESEILVHANEGAPRVQEASCCIYDNRDL